MIPSIRNLYMVKEKRNFNTQSFKKALRGFGVLQIPLVWFKFRVRTCIWLWGFHLSHQRLLWVTFIGVIPGDVVEFTPLSSVFLHIPITLLCLRLGSVVSRRSIIYLSFSLWVGVFFSLFCRINVPCRSYLH
jgi:hypothetical protein